MTVSPARGRIKGAAIGEFVAWYLREEDAPRMRTAALALPPEHRTLLVIDHERLGLLASRWYPAELIHAVLDGMLAGIDRAQVEPLIERAAVATVAGMRRGVYKLLFSWFLTPERYGKLVQAAWERNYDNGSVESTILDARRHRGVVHGWTAHHWFSCRLNVAVKAEIYRAMGCRGVRIEERFCVHDGDPSCGSVIAWEE
ncbi:MAG: hypothetical protein IAG13_30060 [Deltaproteobacteria bacterium]|nr:hypothetical protein [Nannocystaceae bacterium]